ncbi:TIGR03862 family flavoprotein [Flavimaricola marinus]|uniref:HI0933-like protein n=1 Tax=Flavimaricola marinus TaxID=1819565 RepID=A0A238LH91_9RHOB|nr:TIGR03862 family flavoprotein [Flavimaricola marinus]SMY08326.1 HI0933-like protein [Flavimaricola marinus]
MTTARIIGAGPAGLMAAEVLAGAGVSVRIADAMPSPARKFLMAGKSGLNLTKAEPLPAFLAAFGPIPAEMTRVLTDFGPEAVIDWAEGLGQTVFTGSTGRVFPTVMKASPLLRAWLARLQALGVDLDRRWRWTGWDAEALAFDTPDGPVRERPDLTVLAMGGASWACLGSDGAWAEAMPGQVAPFQPANMGFRVDWSPHMDAVLGQPVKGCALIAGDCTSRGEFVLSARGIEGGGVYAVSRAVREGAPLVVDLCPDLSTEAVAERLSRSRGKTSVANHLRKVLGLSGARMALLNEFGRPFGTDLPHVIKALPIRHLGPRPIDEAISTAGGLRFDALTNWQLRARPGIFACGEMLDWEAPTGGYLISACLATGRAAALAALATRA